MNNEFETLYATIERRRAFPEEGSYTNYLFDKGDEKILKKVGEECTEVIIASLSQSKERIVSELADLAYHAFVLMAAKDITIQDVADELERRSKKEHNLKPERKPVEKI